MSPERWTRSSTGALQWLRAIPFFVATLLALSVLPFYPTALRMGIALGVGVLGAMAPPVGVLVFVVAVSLPLAAANFLVGVVFLVVGFISVQYFGQDGARSFVIVALAFIASLFRAEWAMAALAGYMLGAGEGAVAAVVAVGLIELAGLFLGRPFIGVTATGGTKALVDAARLAALKNPLAFGWVAPAVKAVRTAAFVKTFTGARNVALLLAQPLLWAAAAGLTGTVVRRSDQTRVRLANVGIVAGTTALLAVGASVAMSALRGPVPTSLLGPAALVSVALAAACAAVGEWVFGWKAVPVAEQASPSSLRAEDADVDELLRLIASAESALEDRHAIDGVVMITDMKSFSRMTQEQGTVTIAKIIQQHRDLLLPVVEQAGGHGKSTGGDGLLAAFSSADDALAAAVNMQHALAKFNAKRAEDKQVHIRIGIASGDVIVDRSGCPFIGDGLNLAARVMGLADGGQILATHEVIDAASRLPAPAVSHGDYQVKNIAQPVAVDEVLWADGQEPRRPGSE